MLLRELPTAVQVVLGAGDDAQILTAIVEPVSILMIDVEPREPISSQKLAVEKARPASILVARVALGRPEREVDALSISGAHLRPSTIGQLQLRHTLRLTQHQRDAPE